MIIRRVVAIVVLVLLTGCATVPYHYGKNIEQSNTLELAPEEPQIERGKPNFLLDGLGHFVISLPSKLLFLNWKIDNHNISSNTEEKLKQYLADNDLRNVKVRLNQYTPVREWGRLCRNRSIHALWRYSVGALSLVSYTIFPGRLFGGDNYNPFTNTVNIYSDHKSIALHEAGHAKDFTDTKDKGLYAVARILPLVPLMQESKATGDAIGYDRDSGLIKDEKEDYKILYPAYCTYIAGEGLRWVSLPIWQNYAVIAAATIPGHIVGRIKAASVREEGGQ